MNSKMTNSLLAVALISLSSLLQAQRSADLWLTNPDKSVLFQPQKPSLQFSKVAAKDPVIDVDDKQSFQTIDGFGFALTGGSAQLLMRMDPAKRAAILHELFAYDGNNIGTSYIRVSVGASDMNDHVYSYDDLPEGQTDPTMAKFSLDPDRADVIPVLKQILAIDPKIKILASPWSAPPWMKTNNNVKGGKLRPEYYDAYSTYFIKYIQGMKAEGIVIDALTIQNEPLNEKNTPSMQMLAPDQAIFIRDHLGPAFQKASIKTRIVLYDHNCDVPEYATSILKDPEAAKYVDGSGFHLYGGKIDVLTDVHNISPGKNLYFTEQMVVNRRDTDDMPVGKPMQGIVIGATRNWSRNVLLWNLAADPNFGPHTNNGGCPVCQGAITIDGDNVTRNLAYYTVAHASKFVLPGSVRIGSNDLELLPNVAFKTPKGKKVLIVSNNSATSQTFNVRYHQKVFTTSLNAGAVGTYVW
jgi:glucosylceramidase